MANRRQFLKLILGSTGLVALSACTVSEVRRSINAARNLHNGDVSKAIAGQVPGTGIPEFDGLVRQGLAEFLDEIGAYWSDNKTASPKTIVKYTDHYQSRAIIDFSSGLIQVETVRTDNPKKALKQAIVQTLLTADDPSQIDLFSAETPKVGAKPFLLGLVRDHDNKPVQYSWRAQRFAEHLISTQYQTISDKGQTRHHVQFYMVDDYQNQQKQLYRFAVLKQSRRFNLEPALIYSIIETESSFNPYAVSRAPAYGLMQIVPSTAGRDVYRLLNQRDGMPNSQMLFNPATNIEYGAAYLSILSSRYLKAIKDPKTKEFCMIAAYNTGAGNVLKAFSSNRSVAMEKINSMNSTQVYQHLRRNLSSAEARNYVLKVSRNKQKYQKLA